MARRILVLSTLLSVLIFCLPAMAQGGISILATSGTSIETIDVMSGSALSTHPITVPGRTVFGTYGVARDPQNGTIYAVVNYQGLSGRSLITVDPATGLGVHIGTTAIVSDIAFTPDGTLYAAGGNAGAFANQLVTLNKQTGVATAVATLTSGSGHALAFNAEDGLLYHITKPDFFTTLLVETIDPQALANPPVEVMTADSYLEPTGFTHLRGTNFLIGGGGADQWLLDVGRQTLSSLAPASQWKSGLATIPAGSTCPPQGALYGTGPFEGQQFLNAMDAATGAATLIGPIGGVTDIQGIDFAPDGVLYALGRDASFNQVLFTIDPCTAEATAVGTLNDNTLRSLSIQPDGTTLSYAGQVLTFLNRTEPAASPIGDTGIFADHFGFAYSEADSQAYFATVFNAIGTIDAIDLQNATSTSHAQLTLPPNITSLRSMDFNAGDQKLYAIVAEGGLGTATSLASVDPATHAVTLLGPTSSGIEQIAFRSGTPTPTYILKMFVDGGGIGTVTSTPAGIDCPTGACQWYFDAGATVTLTASPAAGSRFDGWSGACSGTSTCITTMNAMRTVRARFNQVFNVHLAYAANNNGHGSVEVYSFSDGRTDSCDLDAGPCDLVVAAGLIRLNALSAPGGAFSIWTPNCDQGVNTSDYCLLSLAADTSVTASFNGPKRLDITVLNSNGESFIGIGQTQYQCNTGFCAFFFPIGTQLSVYASAGSNQVFKEFGGDCSGNVCSLSMTADHSITGTFADAFTVEVSVNGTGSGTVNPNQGQLTGIPLSGVYQVGTAVTLTPAAAAGSQFTGWSGACSGTGTCQLTANAVSLLSATATFDLLPAQTLTASKSGNGSGTVTSAPAGINCGGTCAASFANSSLVTLTPTAATGSTFTGWSGDCTGAGACQVTMSQARSVAATFTLQTFALSTGPQGTGSGTIAGNGLNCPGTCNGTFNYGTAINLTATPTTESTFTGWSGSCTGTGACQFTMDGVRSAFATFNFVGPFQFPSTPPPASTITAGQAATFTITMNVNSATNGTIALACANPPPGATCTFTPNNIPVAPGTNTVITSQLSVTTAPQVFARNQSPDGWAPFAGISAIAMVGMVPWRRRRAVLIMLLLVFSAVVLPSCGGGGQKTTTKTLQSGTPSGTYTITVSGNTATVSHTTTVTMIVH